MLLLFLCCTLLWSYWRWCHDMLFVWTLWRVQKESERNAAKCDNELKFTRIYVKRIEWWGKRSWKIEGFLSSCAALNKLARHGWHVVSWFSLSWFVAFFCVWILWEKFLVMWIVGHVTDCLVIGLFFLFCRVFGYGCRVYRVYWFFWLFYRISLPSFLL